MKKRILAAFLAAALALASAGCGAGKTETQEQNLPWRATAILPHSDQGYWTKLANGMQEEAAEYDGLNLKVRIPQMNYNIDQMAVLIRQETAAQADALLVQGIDDAGYLAALQEAAQAGVKVVLVDTDVETSLQHLYVGTDNYAAGRMLGQALIAETGGEANVMIMSGDEGYPNLDERIRGLRDEVADCEGIRIAGVKYDKYDSLNVLKQYQSILGNYPLVDTIVGVEGTLCMALGPYVNLEEPHMKVVLGFDRCAEADAGLDRGVITGVITQDNEEMGRQAIQMLMQWLETGRLEHSCYYTATGYFTSADYRREQEVKAHG